MVGNTSLIEASDLYRKRYSETAAKFSVSDLLRAQRLVHGTDQAMRFTAQSRFRLEADMVQLVTMPRAVDLAGLIDGIEELKKGGIVPVAAPPPIRARPHRPATGTAAGSRSTAHVRSGTCACSADTSGTVHPEAAALHRKRLRLLRSSGRTGANGERG